MDQNTNLALWRNKEKMIINNIKKYFAEKYKCSLEIRQNNSSFDILLKSRFGCTQKVDQRWLSNNRHLFKIKYQDIIDKILQNMHPIFEPKVISIDLEKNNIICVNYLSDKTTIKLTRFNAQKLNLSHDLV